MTLSTQPSGTALVLGGGGSVGNAWDIGVVAGLADAGVDVTRAEVVVGTSAGATAAAQLSAASPADLLAAILDEAPAPAAARPPAPTGWVDQHLERTGRIIAGAAAPSDMRRRLGAAALELDAESDGSEHAQWRAVVAARLPSPDWPEHRLLITAVDAETGEPAVLDKHSGVDLVDAVAASCSSRFAYRAGGRRLIDGGYRTNADNADLAAGCAAVLVVSPFGGASRTPAAWGLHLATQVERLRAAGSTVDTVFPDERALAAFGGSMMDLSARGPAALAGFDQGRACAASLAGAWR